MIYLDNNSTTRTDPVVVESMLPWFSENYGNAASTTHEMGRIARQAVENARAVIAQAIGATPNEIVFTSGATESNNLAIRGTATHRSSRHKRVVTAPTEHPAVLDPVRRLEKEGFEIDWLSVRAETGDIDFSSSGSKEPAADLVSVMAANNEIGTLLNLEDAIGFKNSRSALLHTDAAQALTKVELDVTGQGIDLMSLSAHKIYGPKGIGALYVRRGVRLKPILDGGGHESGRRSGTLNVPGIVGFARAVELALDRREAEHARIRELMDLLNCRMTEKVGGVRLNGPPVDQRLLGNMNFLLDGIDAETLTLKLPDVCISTGSACTSADPEPSHVLQAVGRTEMEARSSLRIGIGRYNTREEIELAVEQIAFAAKLLRK